MSSATSELKTQIYRAGAGAGKTTTLIRSVIEVATSFRERHGRFPRLVVTTFTRKATQELRERLMLKAQELGDVELLDFVVSKNSLHISTIHGVLQMFLARYGFLLDLDPGFQLVDQKEFEHLAKSILRKLLLKSERSLLLLEDYDLGRLTEMLMGYYRADLTHSNLRSFDMESLEELLKKELSDLSQVTLSIAHRLDAEAEGEGWKTYSGDLKTISGLLKSGNWDQSYGQALGVLSGLKKPRKSAKNPEIGSALKADLDLSLKRLKKLKEPHYDKKLWPEYFLRYELFEPLAKGFVKEFLSEKRSLGQIDMTDLELISWKFIQEKPEMAQAFSKEWDYWFIDEYQDTSPLQVRLLEGLVGKSHSFIVGDPQQSIYLFRGARCEVFSQKEEAIEKTGGERNFLGKNYRSCPELLGFFNDFFSHYGNSFEKMEPRSLDGIDADKSVARFVSCSDEKDELDSIVAHVRDLLRKGTQPGSICVIGRTNKALSVIAKHMHGHRLPTQVHAAAGFYDRREIRDALALLKFLVNPHDNFNLVELLRSPWFCLEDNVLIEKLASKPESYWTVLSKEKCAEPVEALLAYLKIAGEEGVSFAFQKALVERGLIDFSHNHDVTGRREANIWKLFVRLKTEEHRKGFNYLEFVQRCLSDLGGGNEEGDAIAAFEPNRIGLMTVHKSKGLEFDHVILPLMGSRPNMSKSMPFVVDEENGRWSFPVPIGDPPERKACLAGVAAREKLNQLELAEQDRLLYVALTRAKESVFLSINGRDEKNSWWNRMSWDLSTGSHQMKTYKYEVQKKLEVESGLDDVENVCVEPRPMASQQSALAQAEKVSVTSILETKEIVKEEIEKTGALGVDRRVKATSDGILVHRMLEALRFQKTMDVESLALRWFGAQAPRVVDGMNYVMNLNEPPMHELLHTGHVEWGFLFRRQDRQILEGKVDLWGKVDGVNWVVDYKTGSSRYAEKAFSQLDFYIEALKASGEAGEFKKAVIFPFEKKIVIR